FLEQYFAGSPSADTAGKKDAGIQFDLKKIVMKHVNFIKKDAWLGSDMTVNIGSLDMDARKITISNQTVDITRLVLDQPYFSLFDYTGRRPSQHDTASANGKDAAPGWSFRFGEVVVNNGRFRDDQDSMHATVPYFDGAHI